MTCPYSTPSPRRKTEIVSPLDNAKFASLKAFQLVSALFVDRMMASFIFPITDRFVQLLFTDLKKQTKIDKELRPKTLRHTHVVRALKRGEDIQKIFDRLGYAPASRQEAGEMYLKLGQRGI